MISILIGIKVLDLKLECEMERVLERGRGVLRLLTVGLGGGGCHGDGVGAVELVERGEVWQRLSLTRRRATVSGGEIQCRRGVGGGTSRRFSTP